MALSLCRTLIDLPSQAGVARGAEAGAIGHLFSDHFRVRGVTAAGAVRRHRSARDGGEKQTGTQTASGLPGSWLWLRK
jgi:hypothetical protein